MAGTSLPVIWTIPVKKKPNGVEHLSRCCYSLHRKRTAIMKRNVVLLIDADGDTSGAALEAARIAGLDVRFARTSRELFAMSQSGLEDVAAIVLDVDPGVHGMAVLEALDGWRPGPPVIVISSLEESHLRPVALAHGARDCFGKSVSIQRLKTAIAELVRSRGARVCRCDAWGHPCKDCIKHPSSSNRQELAFAEEY
jgi:DNA-binding response OmpR family regulator